MTSKHQNVLGAVCKQKNIEGRYVQKGYWKEVDNVRVKKNIIHDN